MGKKVAYRQCRLQKGSTHQMSWIPEQFAQMGKVLKLKNEDDVWDDGWIVKAVFSRREDDEILDSHDAIKHHRKATGDSMPKEKQRA